MHPAGKHPPGSAVLIRCVLLNLPRSIHSSPSPASFSSSSRDAIGTREIPRDGWRERRHLPPPPQTESPNAGHQSGLCHQIIDKFGVKWAGIFYSKSGFPTASLPTPRPIPKSTRHFPLLKARFPPPTAAPPSFLVCGAPKGFFRGSGPGGYS